MPTKETSDHFGLGVWVSQKRENFITYMENYDTADIGPFSGWMSNSISFYEVDTWAIKTMAHFQAEKPAAINRARAVRSSAIYRLLSGH